MTELFSSNVNLIATLRFTMRPFLLCKTSLIWFYVGIPTNKSGPTTTI